MTDGSLVLLPPPHFQPANEMCLTLVQTVDALLQQMETFLPTNKIKYINYIYLERERERLVANKPTVAIDFKLKSSCWILFCTFWTSDIVWLSPLCWCVPGKH